MDLGNFIPSWNTARNRIVLVAPVIYTLLNQQSSLLTQDDIDKITTYAENDALWATRQVYLTYETGPSEKFIRVNCGTEKISLRRFRLGTDFVNATLGRKTTTAALQDAGVQSDAVLVAEQMPLRSPRSIDLATKLGNSNTRNPGLIIPLRPKRRISRALVAVLALSLVFFLVGSVVYTRIGSFTNVSPSSLTQSAVVSTPSSTPIVHRPVLQATLLQSHFSAYIGTWVTEPGQYLSAIAQALGEETYDAIAQRNGVSAPGYVINIDQHLQVVVNRQLTLSALTEATYVIMTDKSVFVTSAPASFALPSPAAPRYLNDAYRTQADQLRGAMTVVTTLTIYKVQGSTVSHPCTFDHQTELSATDAVAFVQRCSG